MRVGQDTWKKISRDKILVASIFTSRYKIQEQDTFILNTYDGIVLRFQVWALFLIKLKIKTHICEKNTLLLLCKIPKIILLILKKIYIGLYHIYYIYRDGQYLLITSKMTNYKLQLHYINN